MYNIAVGVIGEKKLSFCLLAHAASLAKFFFFFSFAHVQFIQEIHFLEHRREAL